MGSRQVLLSLSLIYLLVPPSAAENLTAVLASARLPTGRGGISALYDGNDTVYLFGGVGASGRLTKTLTYSISQDALQRDLPSFTNPSVGGFAMWNKFQDIYYLSGCCQHDLYQYFPANQSFTTVAATLPNEGYYASIVPDTDSILLFAGYEDRRVFNLSLNDFTLTDINSLPDQITQSVAAIWVEEKGITYLFSDGVVFRYFPSTNQFQLMTSSSPRIPYIPQAVSDGRFWYLIGGNIGPEGRSIIRFDPETEDIETIPVAGHPGNAFGATGAVYVEKLNRIYMFGGITSSWTETYVPDIYYISLGPDRFDCSDKPNFSLHPYAGECSKFVICREAQGHVFDCPEPLQFHPLLQQCNFPELVGFN